VILKPGDTLHESQYRIVGLLDRGAFGYVYQAEDTRTGTLVTIKELVPALVGDEDRLACCKADARVVMQIEHDHLVPILEIFQKGGDGETRNLYLVTEFMPLSLEAWLQTEGALPPAEALRIAAGAALGLDCAHDQGLVHGNLRPANILLGAGPEAASDAVTKVADLGTACLRDDPLSGSWHSPEEFVAGSQPYVAPEQVDGVVDDARTDVYGLGAVLYRLLTGRTYLAFNQQATPDALAGNVWLIRNEVPEPPSVHAPDVPSWLDELVLKALAKQPEDRYTGAGAFHAALVAGVERLSEEMAPVEPLPAEAGAAESEPEPEAPPLLDAERPPEDERKRSRRRSILALAGVLALFLLAAAIAALALSGSFEGAPTPISRQPRTAAAATLQAPRATSTVERASATGLAARRTLQARATASAVSSPAAGVSGTSTATPTSAAGRPTAAAPARPAPLLLAPSAGSELSGLVRFTWQGQGPGLGPNEYFDLRIWSDEEESLPPAARRGAMEPTKEKEAEVALAWAPTVLDYGPGPYYWTVVVVRKPCRTCAAQVVGEWGEERLFSYSP